MRQRQEDLLDKQVLRADVLRPGDMIDTGSHDLVLVLDAWIDEDFRDSVVIRFLSTTDFHRFGSRIFRTTVFVDKMYSCYVGEGSR